MEKTALLNEIKFIELKLQALKAQVESKEPEAEAHTSDSLYGILKGGDDITAEDIDAVKIKLKELP
ncbi:MAG: hypothetical protein HZA06_03015 [Nitrospirae bacterium]|nr:hypothetical protein [Nitrospirota bacterium]